MMFSTNFPPKTDYLLRNHCPSSATPKLSEVDRIDADLILESTDIRSRYSAVFRRSNGTVFGLTTAPGHPPQLISPENILIGPTRMPFKVETTDGFQFTNNQRFELAFLESNNTINLWPIIRAAGKDKFTRVADRINPFEGKDAEECKSYFRNAKRQDGSARWIEMQTKISKAQGLVWLNPYTKRMAYIDEGGKQKDGSYEPPHIDMHYHRPYMKMHREVYASDGKTVLKTKTMTREKVKFPLDPSRPEWGEYKKSNRIIYETHERLKGRDPSPSARTIVPSMQKGGVEFYLAPLDQLDIHPEFVIHHPVASAGSLIQPEEINQIIRELFLGIYICDEYPSLAMDPAVDRSVEVSAPPVYQRTLVNEVLKNIDAFGKGILQGVILPEEGRRLLNEDWRDWFGTSDSSQAPKVNQRDYDAVFKLYIEYGGRSVVINLDIP